METSYYEQIFRVGCFQELTLFLYWLLKPSKGWTVLYNNTEVDRGDFIKGISCGFISVFRLKTTLPCSCRNNKGLTEFKDVATNEYKHFTTQHAHLYSNTFIYFNTGFVAFLRLFSHHV